MGDGDPFADHVPVEHWPTTFLTDEEFEAKFQAWLATHEAEEGCSPDDPFGW